MDLGGGESCLFEELAEGGGAGRFSFLKLASGYAPSAGFLFVEVVLEHEELAFGLHKAGGDFQMGAKCLGFTGVDFCVIQGIAPERSVGGDVFQRIIACIY